MQQSAPNNDLVALLAWYAEMGVDDVVAEEPVDWLARDNAVPGADARATIRALTASLTPRTDATPAARLSGQPAQDAQTVSPPGDAAPVVPTAVPNAPQPATRRFPTAAPDEAMLSARTAAGEADSLAALHAILTDFEGCALKATAKNLCFYRGAERARLMVIGEAPGRDEDIAGKPFVGRAGQLLDKMLAAIDLDETSVHITNLVYWRPPGNRTPTPQEAQVCRPFLDRQIDLVGPDLILLLGGAAAKQMFETTEGIMRLRGKLRDLPAGGPANQETVKALATLHPAYLLRTPAAKRLAWRDLRTVKAGLSTQA